MSTSQNNHIPTEYLEPHFSTKLYKSQLNYLKEFHSESFFYDACSELNMSPEYLLANDNWVSATFNIKFAELLAKKTGDPEVYRKIGRSLLTSENINPLEMYLLSLATPDFVLMNLQKYILKVNQVCVSFSERTGFGKYKIRIWVNDGRFFSHFSLNFQGTLEAMGRFYKLKDYAVRMVPHPDEKGADFYISFSAFGYFFRKLLKLISIVVSSLLLAYFLLSMNETALLFVMGFLISALFGCMYLLNKVKNLILTIEEFNDSNYKSSMEKNQRIHQTLNIVDRSQNVVRQIAHDIRSPLSVLNILIPNLESGQDKEKIELAKKAVDRANKIAEEILESKQGHKNSIDFISFNSSVKQIILEKKELFSVEIALISNLVGNGYIGISDSDLKRVISNLLNNAIDSLPGGYGKIIINISKGESSISVCISDNGKGIAPEILSKIGQKGFTYGKFESQHSGHGLGVYFAKKVAERIGGSLNIKSQLGYGTNVELIVPFSSGDLNK